MDHAQACFVDAVVLTHEVANAVADADHALAAGHDLAVAVYAVVAVDGAHQRELERAIGQRSEPARHATSDM